jgi:hypothetical protein
MERSKGITVYGILIIIFGVYNLIGIGNYRQFSFMFQPLPQVLIIAVYLFTILYGICGVYCGSRMLKLEDWARQIIVALTALSVISGLLLNRTVMTNFRDFLLSEQSQITPDLIDPVYRYTVILSALVTIFELSVIYFFTRPSVVSQFKRRSS